MKEVFLNDELVKKLLESEIKRTDHVEKQLKPILEYLAAEKMSGNQAMFVLMGNIVRITRSILINSGTQEIKIEAIEEAAIKKSYDNIYQPISEKAVLDIYKMLINAQLMIMNQVIQELGNEAFWNDKKDIY